MKKGEKVTYVKPYRIEIGIVKRVCPYDDAAFVVYNCGGDWDNYEDYTAAKTPLKDLKKGWDKEL